ncbi:hypothetical protein [Actinomadura sp. SCN-SB]|uniref:hypothetical protein n=1 Tax=Actinomadura sp. SCN-SB TaxID=3373092 RepID=UPI0037526EE4
MRPRALLLDEPTAHLDVASTAVVESSVADFAAAGGTVLVVSHDAALIARFGGPVLTLRNGRPAL